MQLEEIQAAAVTITTVAIKLTIMAAYLPQRQPQNRK